MFEKGKNNRNENVRKVSKKSTKYSKGVNIIYLECAERVNILRHLLVMKKVKIYDLIIPESTFLSSSLRRRRQRR